MIDKLLGGSNNRKLDLADVCLIGEEVLERTNNQRFKERIRNRIVFLPDTLYKKLKNLAKTKYEVDGVLLYREVWNGYFTECRVYTPFLTGVGDEKGVRMRDNRVKILDTFLMENPDYNYIKFHTHPIGTIEKLGINNVYNFSQYDLKGIIKAVSEDIRFMALLITPFTEILAGVGCPALVVYKETEKEEMYRVAGEEFDIHGKLKIIAKRLGYEIKPLNSKGYKGMDYY